MSFILAHQSVLAAIAGLVVQEFLANNAKIESNSLGQMLVSYVQSFLKSKQTPPSA